jgi:membrane peptidoglycan carboxypeptidase
VTTAHPVTRLLVLCVVAGLTVAGMALPFVGGAGLFARAATQSFERLPDDLETAPPPQRTQILAADGTVVASFFAQDRVAVPLNRIAPVMQKAMVAIEDARYFEHGALDLIGALRAAVTDVHQGAVVQGGSTLTQQYVKNVLLYSHGDETATDTSFGRKLREARYAIALEKRLDKHEILARYLNIVYFGQGAYGIEAAAHRYFGVSAKRLTLGQSALLAGLVQSPSAYDPLRHPDAARDRRNVVLERMGELGIIEPARATKETDEPLGLHPTRTGFGCAASWAPFYCDYVHGELLRDPALGRTRAQRERVLMTGGLTIRTALDPQVQRAAQRAVDRVVPRTSRVATAVAVVQPGTGGVQALAVDRGYGSHADKHQTRVNLALGGSSGFQAGSTFKMFTLAAAIERGVPLSLTFDSPPQVHLDGFEGCGGTPLGSWSPKNAEDGEGGRFGLVKATWLSVNTYFAQLERKIGVCAPWRLAKEMGITEISTGGPPAQVPAFTLGSDDTSPLQVAAAYAALAARGMYCRPQAIATIVGGAGKELRRARPDCARVMSEHTADVTTSILRGVIDGPDPARTGASADIGRPAAGKTGTTDSFAAAWFTGYTPQLAASVWVGDPRGGTSHPLTNVRVGGRFYPHVYGADLPAAVWRATMTGALRGRPALQFQGAGATIARDQTESAKPTGKAAKEKVPAREEKHGGGPGNGHGHGR